MSERIGHVRQSKEKILVTSAIPYVNNVPHMGNIIGCVLSADVFARYHRSQGNDILYVCGTDEHGTATETKALEEGLTPREICDKYYAIHKRIYEWFNIQFDVFGRTSAQNHHTIVQEIFRDLDSNGYIVEREIQQSFCEKDNKFLADRFVEGECPHCHFENARGDQCDSCGKLLDPVDLLKPKCKICGTTPIQKSTKHLFIDLPKLQPKVKEWVEKQSIEGAWTTNAKTTTEAWLERGLEERAITRDLSWGVPVPKPGYENKVFYVWFDAPIGYVSLTDQRENTDWKEWWLNPENVRLYQFMAKDNIPFHTILFPATQMATGKQWTMLHHINATEYLQTEEGKFSKSRGTGLFGDEAMECGIPADIFRYYLLINRPERSDTVFAWKDLQEKLNGELLANLGNLVHRTLTFVKNYHEGKVEETVLDEKSRNFLTWAGEEYAMITDDLSLAREKDALRRIMAVSSRANQYFQEQQPWKTRTEDPQSCQTTMFLLVNLIKDLATLIEPFMPETSIRMFAQLNIEPQKWSQLGELSLTAHTIGTPEPLFTKLEDKDLAAIKERLAAKKKKPEPEVPKKSLQIRVGRIVDVHRHPDAQRLFVETVDFGGEIRTIVSGLVGICREEDLRGKLAVFITNLQPANLRGVESQGMILTAQAGKEVEVFFVDAPAGTYILGSGDEEKITIDEFGAHTFTLKEHIAYIDGKALQVEEKPLKTTKLIDGNLK